MLVWAFANISGLVSFQPGGKIIGINENYARLMFGYSATEVQGKVSLCCSCFQCFVMLLHVIDGLNSLTLCYVLIRFLFSCLSVCLSVLSANMLFLRT